MSLLSEWAKSALESPRAQRGVFAGALVGLAAGVAAAAIVFFGSTPTIMQTPVAAEPPLVAEQQTPVSSVSSARQMAGAFVLRALARKDLTRSGERGHADVETIMTRAVWSGGRPCPFVPGRSLDPATFRTEYSAMRFDGPDDITPAPLPPGGH